MSPDIAPELERDLRYCRTHAFAARLFAGHPMHSSNAMTWAEIARAWEDLADLKERNGLMNGWTAKLLSDVMDDQVLAGGSAGTGGGDRGNDR